MKLNMNVEELRKEILEGARAVPLAQSAGEEGGTEVSERSEKGYYSGKDGEYVGEEEEETSVTEGATEVVGVGLEGVMEVSLESGMLGWLGKG